MLPVGVGAPKPLLHGREVLQEGLELKLTSQVTMPQSPTISLEVLRENN